MVTQDFSLENINVQNLNKEEIKIFISEQLTGRLGVCFESEVYIVPLSYIFMDNKIYVHWFKDDGKKSQLLKKNNQICFEIDEYTKDHLYRKSVIIQGRISKVKSLEEKRKFIGELSKKYPEFRDAKMGHNLLVQKFIKAGIEIMIRKVSLYTIEIIEVTGKTEDLRQQ